MKLIDKEEILYDLNNIFDNISDPKDLLYVLYKNEEELSFLKSFLKSKKQDFFTDNIDGDKDAILFKNSDFNNKVDSKNKSGVVLKNSEFRPVDSIEKIKDIIKSCNRCSDIESRKYSVGSGANGTMIILNAPIMMTNLEKNTYKKDSIELLKKIINAVDLKFDECYIANLIKCETNNMLLSPSKMFSYCMDILKEEIKLVNPEVIIVMGDMLPLGKISRQLSSIAWFNIDHPITMLKEPGLKKKAWAVLQQVKRSRLSD